jgi:DNA repair protein RadA/Sms
MPTGLGELDRVLGGGLVPGSVLLIGGDPGIGKSTLLLQCGAAMGAMGRKVTYVTGEESPDQISLRAQRLGLSDAAISLAAETNVTNILAVLEAEAPEIAIVDSVQTIFHPDLQSAPGTVAQVRDCAAHLTRFAKQTGCAIFLVGHVTKEGDIAGPRVLEHMVDTVLFFEGESGTSFRMLRGLKNRFGAVNEMGVFAMGEAGLEEVSNPSSLFLTQHDHPVPGCAILAAMQGNRPLLVEVQALVEDSVNPNPKRYASGFEASRLQMILAVLNKHAGAAAFDQNVYLKVVGGVRLTEPAADLAALLAVYSSLTGVALPTGLVAFGEVGLAGELRPVQDNTSRLREAAKLGFTRAFVPRASQLPKIDGLEIVQFARVEDALRRLIGSRKAA